MILILFFLILGSIFLIYKFTHKSQNKANLTNSNIHTNFSPNFSLLESFFSFNFLQRFYPIIFTIISLFWIFWLNFTNGFPFLGFAIFGISLITFLLFLIKINRNSLIFGTISMFLSLSFALRSPHFLLIFFNFIGLIYSLSFLILTAKNSFKYNLVNVSFAPIYLLLYIFTQILPFKNIFPLAKYWLLPQFYSQLKSQNNSPIQTQTQNLNDNLQDKNQFLAPKFDKNRISQEIIIGIGISFLVILVILPLLASSNHFFASFLANIFDAISRFFNSVWNFLYNLGFEWILQLTWNIIVAFFDFFSFWNLFLFGIFILFLPRICSFIFLAKIENMENYQNSNNNLQNDKIEKFITNADKNNQNETWQKSELQEKNAILDQKLENKINKNLEVQNSNKLIEKENKNTKQKIDLIQTQNSNFNQSVLVFESDSKLVWLIPKITTIFVLFAFIISQFFLYFTTNLTDLNYNYGKLNNEVFGQLSLVCFVVFGLIYFSNELGIWQRICSFILLAQSVFLGFVAFKSVFDYIANFALTFKRLYGISVVFLVFGFVLIFAVQNFAKFSKSFVLQKSILLVFLTLILINLANFDSLIYYNLPKESDKIDWKYLQELSIDSGNLDKILDKYVVLQREYLQSKLNRFSGYTLQDNSINISNFTSQTKYFATFEECKMNFNNCEFNRQLLYDKDSFYFPLTQIIQKIDYLHSKYNQKYNQNTQKSNNLQILSQIQSFNLSEFSTFQKVKNINLDEIKKEFYQNK